MHKICSWVWSLGLASDGGSIWCVRGAFPPPDSLSRSAQFPTPEMALSTARCYRWASGKLAGQRVLLANLADWLLCKPTRSLCRLLSGGAAAWLT